MSKSPVTIPFSTDGVELAVKGGSTLVADSRGSVLVGADGSTARFVNVDSSGRVLMVGAGTAGTPAGGVLSIQGVSGGQAIPISGTVTASNASVGSTGAAVPGSASLAGATDGTNLQALRAFDADTGGGTQYVLGVQIRKGASGGSVEAGTSSDPLRFDPTGTTTQPISAASLPLPTGAATESTLTGVLTSTTFTNRINTLGQKTMANSTPVVLSSDQSAIPITDNSGSLTVDSTQLPSSLVGGRLDVNTGAWLGSTAPTVGSKTSANSIPVVIASDQGAIPITGSITASNASIGTTGAAVPASATLIGGTDGTNLQSPRVFDADTGGGTQYVLGAILRKGASGGSVEAGTSSDPLRVDPTGTTTQPISAASLPLPTGAATETTLGGVLTTSAFQARVNTLGAKTSANSTPVVLASDQAALPVTDGGGSITVDATSLPLPTGAATEATLLDVLTSADFQARINTLGQKTMSASTPVVIASDQGPIDVTFSSGDVNIDTWLGSAAPTVGQKTMANSIPVVISSDQAALPVSDNGGSLTVDGTVTANLGTIAGVATEATLLDVLTTSAFQARINTLGQNTMAASTPVVIASDQGEIPVSAVSDDTTTDTITSNGDIVISTVISGRGSVAIQITGTWVATLQFEGTVDGSTYVSVGARQPNSATISTNTTANGLWRVSAAGLQFVRVRASAFTSGTATVTIRESASTNSTLTEALPTGSATIGAVTGSGNFNVVGPGATGAAVSGNPVRIAGSDGTNTRNIITDTTGRVVNVGAAASGAAVSGNPVMVGGSDGTNARTITTDTSGRVIVTGVAGMTALLVDGSATTQPISAASLPLPTGAATETTLGGVLTTSAFQARINTLGQKTMANSTPVVIASDQGAIPVTGSITASNPSVSATGSAVPADATMIGATDGTNLQTPRVFDADTGGGTQYVLGAILRKGASGGSVEAGTSSDPLRVDPTGTTTQPISAASLPLPTGAATEATLGGVLTTTAFQARINTLGQKTMANSTPVVISSDQSAITVTGTVTASNPSVSATGSAIPASATMVGISDGTNLQAARGFDADTGGGTQYVLGAVLRKSASGGSVEAGTSTDPLRVDPTGTTTQPVSGTITANIGTSGSLALDATLTGNNQRTRITDGTNLATVKAASTAAVAGDTALVVAISPNNTIPVSGTITANIGTSGSLALDATLTGGTQKAIIRGGAKGSTSAADVTSTAEGADHQAVDVQIYHGGTAINPTAIRALTSSDVVTSAQGAAAALSGYWPVRITDGTNTMPTADTVGRSSFHRVTDGTNTAAVKAASTAPVAGDPALVVAISPNSSLTASNPSVGLTGSAAPTSATEIGGSDGTNLLGIRMKAASTAAVASDPALVVAISPNNSLTIAASTSATGTSTNVASSATNVTVLASNGTRKGATIYNDADKPLRLKLGATASSTSFTVKLLTDSYYEVPFSYTGIIDGIWESGVVGSARVTELT